MTNSTINSVWKSKYKLKGKNENAEKLNTFIRNTHIDYLKSYKKAMSNKRIMNIRSRNYSNLKPVKAPTGESLATHLVKPNVSH